MSEESERVKYLLKYWSHLQLAREYEKLENIIKEIRECIGQHKRYRYYAVKGEIPISTYESAGLELINKYEIKKILDKENK